MVECLNIAMLLEAERVLVPFSGADHHHHHQPWEEEVRQEEP
jgi:hypothetical protein